MKVSFLIANMGVRGSIRRIVELSNHLIQRGHEALVYHSDGSPCSWLTCLAPTIPEHKFVKDIHDRVIYFGDPPHWQMMKQAKANLKCFYVLGLNEKEPDLRSILTGNYKVDSRTQAVRESIHDPEIRVLVNCNALAEFMTEINVKSYPVVGGINTNVFYPRQIPRDEFLVLAGGAKRDIEGTTLVLKTMEMVKAVLPKAHLELYAKKGYSQDYLADLYSSAGVFLDAQRYGGWNNPVAEAMACGCPVVCTDIWGNREFAVNKVTAMLANDPAKMAWAIIRILKEPDLVQMLTQNASIKIFPFTWARTCDQLLEALA